LDIEYLGVNSLFINILQMLSLAELGVGTAITFSLYTPLFKNDTEQIKKLMNLYQKIYAIIGGAIFFIGIILSFFINQLVETSISANLQVIFILFLIKTSFTYFFAYKRALITADQKSYLLVPFTTIFVITMKLLQIFVLIRTGNYYLFLIIDPTIHFIENIVINRYIDQKYSFLKYKLKDGLSENTKKEITSNTKAMIYHKIGDYVLNGTDSILISHFIGVRVVGLYANYLLIISAITTFVRLILSSATSSFGNLIAEGDEGKKNEVFLTFNFIGFWILSWSSTCLFVLLNPFITLWLGEEFLLGTSLVTLLVLNFYVTGMRIPVAIIKTASGIYNQDKFVPVGQSILNLLFSLLLVRDFGLNGIFMGTLISSILPSIYRPIIVYKNALNRSSKIYFRNFIFYLIITVATTFILNQVIIILLIELSWVSFIFITIICLVIPNIIIILAFHKSLEFKRALNIIKTIKKGNI